MCSPVLPATPLVSAESPHPPGAPSGTDRTVSPSAVAGRSARRYRRTVAMSDSPAGAAADWCVRCAETALVLLTDCPTCGVLPLCPACIVDHVATICEQQGVTLGP